MRRNHLNVDSQVNQTSKIREIKLKFWKSVETERKRSSHLNTKQLAEAMGKGSNFLSSFINGRSDPSFDTFWSYLIEAGFDIEPLMNLKIHRGELKEHVKIQNEIIKTIASIEDEEVLLAFIEMINAALRLKGAKYKR